MGYPPLHRAHGRSPTTPHEPRGLSSRERPSVSDHNPIITEHGCYNKYFKRSNRRKSLLDNVYCPEASTVFIITSLLGLISHF